MKTINYPMLAIIAVSAFSFMQNAQADPQGSSPDLLTLQAQVDKYTSTSMTNDLNSLISNYDALGLGQTYTSDSPKLGPVSDGNADSSSTKMTYSGKNSSQLIGYADDQCAAHTAYDTLVSKGVKVDKEKFDDVRGKFCKLVNAAAELQHRYDKYKSIQLNGIVLAKRSRSQSHDFEGFHRTFGVGMDLIYKPDLAHTIESGIHPDETLVYNSWMKWSDDNPTPLNVIKKIREMKSDGAAKCDGFSLHVINGPEADGWLYLNVVNVSSSKVTIQNCAKVDFNKTHKTHAFPELTVDAPFGYLYEVEQMKDTSKSKMKDTIKNKVASMIDVNKQMIALIQKIK